jgi:hypothetical protein
VEMTDQKPWRLQDLAFESMGDDQKERATIDGVEIVRQDGRYWINSPHGQWTNLDGGWSTPLRRRRTGCPLNHGHQFGPVPNYGFST